jgi:hypothetical protein
MQKCNSFLCQVLSTPAAWAPAVVTPKNAPVMCAAVKCFAALVGDSSTNMIVHLVDNGAAFARYLLACLETLQHKSTQRLSELWLRALTSLSMQL